MPRQRLIDASCSLKPPWADGALSLAPLAHEQVNEAGLGLSYDHIATLNSGANLIKAALKEFNFKSQKQPKGGLLRCRRPRLTRDKK